MSRKCNIENCVWWSWLPVAFVTSWCVFKSSQMIHLCSIYSQYCTLSHSRKLVSIGECWKVNQQVNCKLCPSGSAPSSQRQSSTSSALLLDLHKSYLWQYHSPWHREHLFAASLPQDPHFGFSGSKLSITSKLYVWANLVKKTNKKQNRFLIINTVQIDRVDSSETSPFKLVISVLPLCLQLQVTFRRVESFFHLILCYRLPLPRILSQNVVPYFWDLHIKQSWV